MRITLDRATSFYAVHAARTSLHGRSCLRTGRILTARPMYLHVSKYMRKHLNWFLRRKRCSAAESARIPIAIMQCIYNALCRYSGCRRGDRKLPLLFTDRDWFVSFIFAVYRHLLIIFLLTDCFFFSIAYLIFEKLY